MSANRLIINYGGDIAKMTFESLGAYGTAGLIPQNHKILIKPNLVNSTPAQKGATTHPEVVEGIIEYLFENGFKDIEIVESSWVGGNTDEAFKVCGYERLSKKYGIPCVNVLKGKFIAVRYGKLTIDVYKPALENAFLINVPVMKAHCQTQVTCCIKNLKGLIPSRGKRDFHSMGLHEPIAALGAIVKTGLNVVDGICGDLTFEEGGTPVQTNMLIVGEDPLLIDSFVCEFIGYNPKAIKYLMLSEEYGTGKFYSAQTALTVLNSDKKPKVNAKASGRAAELSKYINEKEACSACYSSLIHALHKAGAGALRKYENEKISIGQGFKGVKGEGIGFGNCASGFSKCVRGCPPKALDAIKEL